MQGVIKLITDGVPRSKPGGHNEITTEFETKLSARLNGNGVTGRLGRRICSQCVYNQPFQSTWHQSYCHCALL